MDKINLKEILNRVYDKEYRSSYKTEYSEQCIIEDMKEACRQVLERAADNASVDKIRLGIFCAPEYAFVVNRESILDTINEIE